MGRGLIDKMPHLRARECLLTLVSLDEQNIFCCFYLVDKHLTSNNGTNLFSFGGVLKL